MSTLRLNYLGTYFNTLTRFIQKKRPVRRRLVTLRCKYGNKARYFRHLRGGVKEYFAKLGRSNICRVKSDSEHSNHLKNWTYINKSRVKCLKHFSSRYGGTIAVGVSRSLIPRGLSKLAIWSGNSKDVSSGMILGYSNRTLSFN